MNKMSHSFKDSLGVMLVCLAVVISATIGAIVFARAKRIDLSPTGNSAPQPTDSTAQEQTRTAKNIRQVCFLRYNLNEREAIHLPRVYVKDLSSGKERYLGEGSQADISPQGDQVAFVGGKFSLQPGTKDPSRIKILNLRTNQLRDFSTLTGRLNYSPIWSPDGQKIAFVLVSADYTRADIGVLDPVSGKWENISQYVDYGQNAGPIFLDSWLDDGRSLIVHSFQHIYELSLDGKVLQKLDAGSLKVTTSDTKFYLSADRRHLLFNRLDDSPEGPVGVIYLFDVGTKKLARITPESIGGSGPRWLPSEKEILFTCGNLDKMNNFSGICTIGLDGTGLKTLLKNGSNASYSTQ